MADTALFNLLPYRPVPTGLSRYVERLLAAWPGPPPIQLRLASAGAELAAGTSRPVGLPRSRWLRWLQANALAQHALPVRRLVAQVDPAVIYSPYTDLLLAVRDRPQVITCHDLTPLVLPNSRRAYWRSRLWLPRHLHRATRVIAISRTVADQLVDQGLPASRIIVVANGVEPVADPLRAPAGSDCLVLARHARNKNVGLALQGFAQLLRHEPLWPGQLVVVGGAGRHTPALQRLERDLGLGGRVRWLPHLDEQALERQWRASFCLISPSLMEGFDYPLLEAQVRGLPTLASQIPVHRELHTGVALLFELQDGGCSLGRHLQQLARDSSLWQQLSQAGLAHAKTYSVARQASSIAQVLEATARWSAVSAPLC